jgi:hypothetical protein
MPRLVRCFARDAREAPWGCQLIVGFWCKVHVVVYARSCGELDASTSVRVAHVCTAAMRTEIVGYAWPNEAALRSKNVEGVAGRVSKPTVQQSQGVRSQSPAPPCQFVVDSGHFRTQLQVMAGMDPQAGTSREMFDLVWVSGRQPAILLDVIPWLLGSTCCVKRLGGE